MKADITLGQPGETKVVLDGHDVTGGFRGLHISHGVGEIPTLQLDAPLWETGWVGGEVKVEMVPATHEALIALGWAPPGEYPGIDRIKRVSVQPGDTLVVETEGPMDMETMLRVKDRLEQTFPGHRVIVLDKGMKLGVMSDDRD